MMLRLLLVSPVLACPASAQCFLESLTAPGIPDDLFGFEVAVSGDTVVASSGPSVLTPDAVHVFERTPTGFVETQVLTGEGRFGTALAIEGDRLVVGAPLGAGNASDAGAVYVFERGPAGFVETARLVASDGDSGDRFGASLDLSGPQLLVGAPNDADPTLLFGTGSAYVFRLHPLFSWTQAQKLVAQGPSLSGQFGVSVDLDGGRALIGDDQTQPDPMGPIGLAHVFQDHGPLAGWVRTAVLAPAGDNSVGFVGRSVALEGDTALVSATNGTPAGGAIHVFEVVENVWVETQQLVPSGGTSIGQIGTDLALEGGRALVGRLLGSVDAWLFEKEPQGFVEVAALDAGAGSLSTVGRSVALSSGLAVVGPQIAKAAHVFEVPDGEALFGCPEAWSIAAGGTQALALDAGDVHAFEPYLLLGSLGGTSPGVRIDSFVLPLNVDDYTLLTLVDPAASPLEGSVGLLDATGSASAAVVIPSGAPLPVGLTAHHAFVTVGPSGAVSSASNAEAWIAVP